MLKIRPATIQDAELLAGMILELAEYEHLRHEAAVTPESVARDGFGPHPKFRAVIAEWDQQVSGYALFYEFYSTFQARAGLFLEDIFVRPQFRKQGIGQALLNHVARIAWNENYFCMRWEVLDWNKPRSEEHTSELQSRRDLVCRLLLEKKKNRSNNSNRHT